MLAALRWQRITTPNISEAETNRTFIAHARKLVVLADHTKWRTIGLHILAPLSTADTVITDQGIAPEGRQLLASHVDDLRVASARSWPRPLAVIWATMPS